MKRKKLKCTVSLAVLSTMILTTPAFASPVTQEQINATKGQISATLGQINDTQAQLDALENRIMQLDDQISQGMVKIGEINDNIRGQQAQIEKTKTEIQKVQKDLDTRKKIYANRLRSYQTQGNDRLITYAEILFSSNTLSDFLTRSTAITQILQSDSDLMKQITEKEDELEAAKQKLDDQLEVLKKQQEELKEEQAKVEADKQEVENQVAANKDLLQQQQAQEAQQQAQLQAQQAQWQAQQEAAARAREEAERQARLRAQQSQGSSGTSSSVSFNDSATASEKAATVIAYAKQFLGVDYVWGGSSPSGFDCSGLMQYSFSHALGIHLPRVAADQQDAGTRISPYDVLPGDLVFKGDPAFHVGLYIGGGQWIQAPQTGDVVKISYYNPASFSSAARILR